MSWIAPTCAPSWVKVGVCTATNCSTLSAVESLSVARAAPIYPSVRACVPRPALASTWRRRWWQRGAALKVTTDLVTMICLGAQRARGVRVLGVEFDVAVRVEQAVPRCSALAAASQARLLAVRLAGGARQVVPLLWVHWVGLVVGARVLKAAEHAARTGR